jgi:ferritin-like metal-binding protein YciE
MFEHLNTPEEVFHFKLGAALKMENEIIDMLAELDEHAKRDELKQAIRKHSEETRRHVANIEQAFKLLGQEVDDSPCPAIEGLKSEGKANLKKADDSLADVVILSGIVETEHHEIGVYENLIAAAEARGAADVATLLRENLQSEQRTLEDAKHTSQEVLREGAPVGTSS